MPIICEECGSFMQPDLLTELIKCTNPECSYWHRHLSRLYEFVLKLEERINAQERERLARNNKWEKACREWLKSCSCADEMKPEECESCTKAFLEAVKRIESEDLECQCYFCRK